MISSGFKGCAFCCIRPFVEERGAGVRPYKSHPPRWQAAQRCPPVPSEARRRSTSVVGYTRLKESHPAPVRRMAWASMSRARGQRASRSRRSARSPRGYDETIRAGLGSGVTARCSSTATSQLLSRPLCQNVIARPNRQCHARERRLQAVEVGMMPLPPKPPAGGAERMCYAHQVFSPCRHHAAARFSGVSTPRASARIIHVKPHQSETQPPWT